MSDISAISLEQSINGLMLMAIRTAISCQADLRGLPGAYLLPYLLPNRCPGGKRHWDGAILKHEKLEGGPVIIARSTGLNLGIGVNMSEDSLKLYREKRNFAITPEPGSTASEQEKAFGKQIFVIQKHDARNLHYDFRLEVDGVLKSWAVPKGPSTDPKIKRLAVMTEDHPLDYAEFEGVIPEGHYGAGTVIVWDIGYYTNMTEKGGQAILMGKAIENGHLAIWLEGKKLKGGYALTRTQRGWILVKMKDNEANSGDILGAKPRSALSDRTIEEVAALKELKGPLPQARGPLHQ